MKISTFANQNGDWYNKNIHMARYLLMLIFIAISSSLVAQKFTNFRAKKESGKVMINYDFSSDSPGKTFDVRLECSSDGGSTFTIYPQFVTGDVSRISSGTGKLLIWDVMRENMQIAPNQLAFQLVAIENNLEVSQSIHKGTAAPDSSAGDINIEGTFTDSRDGHIYKWVKIGQQIWMAENLAFLPVVSHSREGSQSKPFFYVYGYNGINIDEARTSGGYISFGVLYNWAAAKNACPAGWHIPSMYEWEQLEIELGMSETQANSKGQRGEVCGMKIKSAEGWNKSGNGTNESGFSALPGGGRYGDGSFGNAGTNGYWWSSSSYETAFSWGRGLTFDSPEIYNGVNYKENGFSVRCVKD